MASQDHTVASRPTQRAPKASTEGSASKHNRLSYFTSLCLYLVFLIYVPAHVRLFLSFVFILVSGDEAARSITPIYKPHPPNINIFIYTCTYVDPHKPKPKPKRQPSPPPTTDAEAGDDDDDHEPVSGKRPKHSFKSVTLAEAIASSSSASHSIRPEVPARCTAAGASCAEDPGEGRHVSRSSQQLRACRVLSQTSFANLIVRRSRSGSSRASTLPRGLRPASVASPPQNRASGSGCRRSTHPVLPCCRTPPTQGRTRF